jgi:hypothetical protein
LEARFSLGLRRRSKESQKMAWKSKAVIGVLILKIHQLKT